MTVPAHEGTLMHHEHRKRRTAQQHLSDAAEHTLSQRRPPEASDHEHIRAQLRGGEWQQRRCGTCDVSVLSFP